MASAFRRGLAALGIFAALGVAQASAQTITLWSHWADQQTKVDFVTRAARSLEAKNPGVRVQITWYQKGPLYEALGAALRARRGPDVFYIDNDRVEYIENGLLEPLDTLVAWNNVEDWARRQWVFNGKTYALPLEAFTNEVYYNRRLMAGIGMDPGPNRQFTQAQFIEMIRKGRAANTTPVVAGVGDRPSPGAYVLQETILKALGKDDYARLLNGRLSWLDPRVTRAFAFVQEMVDAGAYPTSLTSLKLGESHYYFYTSPGGLTLPMGSWYTSRAFNPPDKGGQPVDFPLGIMNFPALDGAACNECKTLAIGGSFAINANSANKRLAAALLNEMSTPEMGSHWLSTVLVQTGVKADPSKIEGPYKSYFAELLALNARNEFYVGDMLGTLRGACAETFKQVLNVAFPAGLMKAPEAQSQMDRACFRAS
jgi:multiple sugar transport system substrate-binding protein